MNKRTWSLQSRQSKKQHVSKHTYDEQYREKQKLQSVLCDAVNLQAVKYNLVTYDTCKYIEVLGYFRSVVPPQIGQNQS